MIKSIFFRSAVHVLTFFALASAQPPETSPGGISDADFEEAATGDAAPKGWRRFRWGKGEGEPAAQVTEADAHHGRKSAMVRAVAKAAEGFVSPIATIPAEYAFVTLEVSVKRSADYVGNNPWVFLSWYRKGTYVGRADADVSELRNAKWGRILLEVPRADVPEGAGQVAINLATSSGASERGELYFDAVRLGFESRRRGPMRLELIAAADFSWFHLGEPIRFNAKGEVPADLETLLGEVFDATGARVGEARCDRGALAGSGWAFTPSGPGYFEIVFTLLRGGERQTVNAAYSLRSPKGNGQRFIRDRYGVAVVPPEPAQRPAQFGFSYQMDGEVPVRLARLVGFSFARLHAIPWGAQFTDEKRAIEPERGVYRWEQLDPHVALLKSNAFPMVGNVVYTPAWASPHPEDSGVNICVVGRNAYAPVKIEYLQDFLTAMVGRYGNDIKTWEIWNEQHLPGGSCFWKDTPEAYVRMLRGAHQTLKRLQPDGEVWIGGMGGKRYLPFYREFLKLGGAPFDRLAIHGSWPDLTGYRALEAKYRAPSVPWVSSEWHALLLNPLPAPPSEAALARRMILDAVSHLKDGCERLAMFQVPELIDKEALPWAASEGWFVHSSGLFRGRPRLEPRLAAVVMRTFLGQIERRLAWRGLADFSGGQRLAWFDNGPRTFAVLWTEASTAAPLDSRLASALGSATILRWDGASVAAKDIHPVLESVYFIRGIPASFLATLAASTLAINPARRSSSVADASLRAPLAEGPLFDDALRDQTSPAFAVKSWKWVGNAQADCPAGFQARFAVATTPDGLDLRVDVEDAAFAQNEKAPAFWNGDSLQFAIDCGGASLGGDQAEFIVAQTQGGTAIWKTLTPYIGGDLPQKWTPAMKPAHYAQSSVERLGSTTRYRVRIAWSELYPLTFDPTQREYRVSLLVNNNDGRGRAGWLEWGGGIGSEKDPALYGRVVKE